MPLITARRTFVCGAMLLVLLAATLQDARAQPGKEIYQDFRGGKGLVAEWKYVGTKEDKAGMNPDDKGLRITIPKTRRTTQVVGIRLMFPLSGDFEITAQYEVVDMEKPAPGGQPVGVAFNLVVANDHKKMAKLGRFMRWNDGDVHLAEVWMPGNNRPVIVEPATKPTGKLRLVRQGKLVSYAVADGADAGYREIFKADFSDEDLEIVRIGANNNATPAGVDVRIIDVRIHPLAPGAAPRDVMPAPASADVAGEPQANRAGWLVAIAIMGAVVVLLIVGVIAAVVFLRQRKA
jgi:hypothetical protein